MAQIAGLIVARSTVRAVLRASSWSSVAALLSVLVAVSLVIITSTITCHVIASLATVPLLVVGWGEGCDIQDWNILVI